MKRARLIGNDRGVAETVVNGHPARTKPAFEIYYTFWFGMKNGIICNVRAISRTIGNSAALPYDTHNEGVQYLANRGKIDWFF